MYYVTRDDEIVALELSKRAYNCLTRAGVSTVGQMMDYPDEDLIKIRSMGVKTLEEIREKIRTLTDGTGSHMLEGIVPQAREQRAAVGEDRTGCRILVDETGAIKKDLAVQQLLFSLKPNKARNSLLANNIWEASQLIGITYEELIKKPSVGKKTAQEIAAFSETITISAPEGSFAAELASQLAAAYGKTETFWLKQMMDIREKQPEVTGDALIARLYDDELLRDILTSKILRLVEGNGDEMTAAALKALLPLHLRDMAITDAIVEALADEREVELEGDTIRRRYPTIVEFVAGISDERTREVIQGRLEGKTLNEIGERFGVVREYVRQIESNGLKNKPVLREDRYRDIYEQYYFTPEDFMLAFGEPKQTYYYLDIVCKVDQGKKKPLEDMLADTRFSIEIRKKVEKAVYKHCIAADGVQVRISRPDLMKHYVRTHCRSLTQLDAFTQGYNQWLEGLGLSGNADLCIDARTCENFFNRCNYALWNQGKRFRYYNIAEYDFEELLAALDLEQFEDTEFSALKLFRDYPVLMEQYDIRDENELHNLLKKIWSGEKTQVKFGKMPTIIVGQGDAGQQVMALLQQYAPIGAEDLARRYEEEYGVRAASARGSTYFKSLSPYLYKGVYAVDYKPLAAEQQERMKAVLVRDFYTIQEVKRLYRREFPQADGSMLNPYTLKMLGFHVYPGYSGYIVKNTYAGATDFFNAILTGEDLVDMRDHDPAIRSLATYDSEHRRLRSIYEIVEYAPLQYINIRRLNTVDVTRADLEGYCRDVAACCDRGEYFTVKSIRRDGFVHPLDDLGFEEWFYSSVLFEDRARFSAQRIGGTRLFLRGRSGGNLAGMLEWLLEEHRKMDFYDLQDLLENRYGISLPREKLMEIINGTELYYDRIMEAVYIDYETYFEEI